MTKLTGETLNIEEENIKKIKELFPEVDTDGKIDFEKLKQLLGDYVEDADERYNFTWNGKGEALRISQTPSVGTLRPALEESKNWAETNNLYIEGDNLEVLKLLQKSYFNKIKMIYIDPPYNTGTDIIYKNDFSDPLEYYKNFTGQIDSEGFNLTTNTQSTGRFHTKWLNLMYPRLRLARNLMSENGIIFIAIDDNEVHNLIKIADEIFGENNRIANLCVVHKPEGRNQAKFFGPSHEYALVYAKNIRKAEFRKVAIDEELKKKFKYQDNKGKYKLKNFIRMSDGKYSLRENKPSFYYPVYVSPDLDEISSIHKPNYYEVFPITESGQERTWKTTKETFFERYENGDIIVRKENDMIKVYEKLREFQVLKTHWIDKQYHGYHYGTKVLDELLEMKSFDFPKSVHLVRDSIEIITEEDDIILDFFSGSATTAHAVMDLNAADGGNRKFIMVQLPEEIERESETYKAGYKNIAHVGRERIRRAGKQIKKELTKKYNSASEEERKEMKRPDTLDVGFKTFKLDSSNIKEWNPGQYEDVQLAIEDSLSPYTAGRTEKDVVYEMMLKMGLDLTYSVDEYEVGSQTIYSIGYGALMISLSDKINLSIASKMIEIKDEHQPEVFRVIFRDEGFGNDTDKTNIKETLRSAGLAEEAFITL